MTPEPTLSSLAEACAKAAKQIRQHIDSHCEGDGECDLNTAESEWAALILAHLQPLAKDSQRLDWLEQHGHARYSNETNWAVSALEMVVCMPSKQEICKDSIRAAIDSAMLSTPKPASSS